MKDFFISYNKSDKAHALAIQCWLEDAGFTTVMQATDFHAGSNFVLEMHKATNEAARTIAILSPDYLKSAFTAPEWAAAFAKDPTGASRKLLTVRVRECAPTGLLQAIVYIDLVGLDIGKAQKTLISGLEGKSPVPEAKRVLKKRAPRKVATEHPLQPPGINQNAVGKHIYQAAGPMHIHQKPQINKTDFVRESHHITEAQAADIKQRLDELGERDEKAGKGGTYGKWMNMFKHRFELTTYKALPEMRLEEALSWIRQQKAINRSSLRRTNNEEWRKDHLKAIWASAHQLDWGKEAVHQAAQNYFKLKTPIDSVSDLGEQKLEKFAAFMRRESKKRR